MRTSGLIAFEPEAKRVPSRHLRPASIGRWPFDAFQA